MKKLRTLLLVLAALLAGHPADATIGVAQDVVSASTLTAASSTTITASITISANSRLWAYAVGDTGTAASATFSDSGSGTWTTHTGPNNISNFRSFSGSSLQLTSGTKTVTCTYASAMSNRGMIVVEITGADNNAVQDAKGQHTAPGTGTDIVVTPNMTATAQPCLVVGSTRTNGGATPTAGTGFTGGTLRWSGSGDGARAEWRRDTTTGTKTCTWTPSGSADWWSDGAVFGEAGGGGSTPDFQGFIGQPGLAIAPPPATFALPVLVPPISMLVSSEIRP